MEDCVKGNEAVNSSKSTALVKQIMSVFRSDNNYAHKGTRDHDSNCNYVCTYCKRSEFSSGIALREHMMRAHGSLSGDGADAEAACYAYWDTNHHHHRRHHHHRHHLAAAGGMHETLEQLSSSAGDGDSRPTLRDFIPDADGNLVLSDSTHDQALSWRRKLDFRPGKLCKIAKNFGDDPHEILRRKIDDDYRGEKEDDEDASVKAISTTSTTYSNVLEDDDGDNAHETESDNAEFKAHGSLYSSLRKNRKPSKRLVDPENHAMESMQGFFPSSPVLKKATASCSLNHKAHACTECGKEFVSWKALFGHMRCHPEREWRGIQRPISLDLEKQSTDTFLPEASSACKKQKAPSLRKEYSKSDSAIQQTVISDGAHTESIEAADMNGGVEDSLLSSSWMTGKRSKRPRKVASSLRAVTDHNIPEVIGCFHDSSEIKEDADMANCLVMLACASRNEKEHPRLNYITRTMSISSNGFDTISDARDIVYKKKRSMDLDRYVRPNHWLQRKEYSSKMLDNTDDSSLCEGMNEIIENRRGEETLITTKTRTDLLAGKLKYECSTCKRIFKSHQALGGHRASHKKVKGCFARTHAHPNDMPDSPEEEAEEEEDITNYLDHDLPRYSDEERARASGRKYHEHQIYGDGEDEKETTSYSSKKHAVGARMKGHECSICHRVFSSGQALGGHKRCHWAGLHVEGSETSADHVRPVSSASQQPATAHVQLDLNLPAPEEYDDLCMDCKISPTAAQMKTLTTNSISDKNIMATKFPGEFISSLNYAQQKPSHLQEKQFLYAPGLKLLVASDQAGTSAVQNHDVAGEEYSNDLEISAEIRDNNMNSSRYLHCNVCDQICTSVEALGSHQKTHASVMSSTLAGLTPISA